MERGVFVIDLHIRELLRILAHRRGQLGERLFAVEHDLHELDGRQQSVASIGIFAENNVPGLFAADQVSVGAHILCDVFITNVRLFIADAGLVERLVQAEVGHDRRDHFGIAEAALSLHIACADIQDLVAVDDRAVFIHGQAAVGVAVKGKAHVQPVEADILLQVLDVRRAAVPVDVRAVGSLPMTYVSAPSASKMFFAIIHVLPLAQSRPTFMPLYECVDRLMR